jgi:hypothetical protein
VGFVIDYLISLPPLSFRDILDLIQTIGLIIVLWITFVQLRKTIKSNRAFASLQITTSHREIWSHLLTDESLERIVKENVDLEKEPITKKEGYFVIMVVNHMSAVYDAYRQGIHRIYPADMREFFKLPIPNKVWNEIKPYQAKEFVDFIEKLQSEEVEES